MKKLLSLILVSAMVFNIAIYVKANDFTEVSIDEIDNLLREANTPESKISEMDDDLKRFIYENSLSREDVEYINVEKEETTGGSARTGDQISQSELKLSVIAFKVYGQEQVAIYPTYEWLVPVKPRGKDYFGYSTHDSYSVVSNKRSNLMWYKINENDEWESDGSATYTGSSMTGYQHYGSSLGSPDFPLYLRGNFYYKVDINSTSPVKKIAIAYVHDTSSGLGLSYGIAYGPLSISVTPSSNNTRYLNNVFNLDY